MTEFLLALLAMVSSFAQNGQPVELPPHTQEEVAARGKLISEIAKNLHTDENTEQNDDEEITELEDELTEGTGDATPSGTPQNDEDIQPAHTAKVAAVNVKSGKTMPALIPQVAIDNSPALEAAEEGDTASEEEQGNGGIQPLAAQDFGQGVANSQPDSAQNDGKTFGQTVSESAKANSNRP